MRSLSDISARDISVFLLQTSSTWLEMFLMDRLKERFGCRGDAVIEISTQKDYRRVREVSGASPPFAEKWFVPVRIDKLFGRDLVSLIKSSSTCLFFCTCSRYSVYRDFKESFSEEPGFMDFYINYLRRADFVYLYDSLAVEKLSKPLMDFAIKSYSGDIDAVFRLLMQLNQGTKVSSRHEITDICGVGGLSVEGFIFDLLKDDISGSDKGLAAVMRNRMKSGSELIRAFGLKSFYSFISRDLRLFCEMKMLIISGAVYKRVYSLPDGFDEKALMRYQRFIPRLKVVPMSRLLALRQCLGDKWDTELDYARFIYEFYTRKVGDYVSSMPS